MIGFYLAVSIGEYLSYLQGNTVEAVTSLIGTIIWIYVGWLLYEKKEEE